MTDYPLKVVTVAQMQALEAASERAGVSVDALMENAGLACALRIRQRLGGLAGRRVLALIGPGNNGADGLVIARHLRRWGAEACCYVVRGRPDHDPKMADAMRYGVAVIHAVQDPGYARLSQWLSLSPVVVDAVLGAGRYRPLEGAVKEILDLVNRYRSRHQQCSVVSVDLPTGVHPDTGAADPHALSADETLALGHPKQGVATFPGAGYAGRIVTLDIGLPASASDSIDLPVQWMSETTAAELLPQRPLDSHKGTFGRLLIVAGSRNFVGATTLAALAAHRVGTGLVTLATPESVYPIAAAKLTETIHLPLPEDADGRIAASAADAISDRIDTYSALAVGCGLGWSHGTVSFLERLLLAGHDPPNLKAVIDADGLNSLSDCADWPQRLRADAVLTPHPGEMATLTGRPTAHIQAHRLAVASESAIQWRQTTLLKGANSVVASPDGQQAVLPFINPALAAGGTGDVLTGVIGGLLAQGLSPFDAARLGGFLHGAAGEMARRNVGSAGVLASDLLPLLPQVINRLRG